MTITNKESAPHNEAPKAFENHTSVSSSSGSTTWTHETGDLKTSSPSDKSEAGNKSSTPKKSGGGV